MLSKYVYLTVLGLAVGVVGIAAQLYYSRGASLSLGDLVAFLITLTGVGLGAISLALRSDELKRSSPE